MTWTSRSPAPSEGVTALQMDIKITGVTTEILRNALTQAREARLFILGKMSEALAAPRDEVAEHAPRIISTKVRRTRSAWSSARVARRSAGSRPSTRCRSTSRKTAPIRIYGANGELAEQARSTIDAMCKDVEVGDEYTGKVVKIAEFGAFIELTQGRRRPAAREPHPPEGQPAAVGRPGHGARRRRPRPGGRGRQGPRPHRPHLVRPSSTASRRSLRSS